MTNNSPGTYFGKTTQVTTHRKNINIITGPEVEQLAGLVAKDTKSSVKLLSFQCNLEVLNSAMQSPKMMQHIDSLMLCWIALSVLIEKAYPQFVRKSFYRFVQI